MKVHRCPHCGKPFLESEAADGRCPVCRGAVAGDSSAAHREEDPGPDRVEDTSTADHPREPKAPHFRARASLHRLQLSVIALLLVALVAAIVLWQRQIRDLRAERDTLQERLSNIEQALTPKAAGPAPARKIAKVDSPRADRPAASNAPVPDGQIRTALAKVKSDPSHQSSQAILSTAMRQDASWIEPISELSPSPQWATSTLIALLRHREAETRRLAAEALGRIRPPGPIVQAVLEKTTRDPDPRVRTACREALQQIRSGS